MAAVSCTELGTIVVLAAEDASPFGTLSSGAAACSLEVTGSPGGLAFPGSEKAFAEDVVVPLSSTTSSESAFVVPGMWIRLPERIKLLMSCSKSVVVAALAVEVVEDFVSSPLIVVDDVEKVVGPGAVEGPGSSAPVDVASAVSLVEAPDDRPLAVVVVVSSVCPVSAGRLVSVEVVVVSAETVDEVSASWSVALLVKASDDV